MHRYKLFDQLRGLAIVAMVMANSAPLLADHVEIGFWFRLLSSFPAPCFVIMAGAMVALTASKHKCRYFFERGIFVVLMGAFVDVAANNLLPFESFDVLYLIGVMMPIAFLACRLTNVQLFGVIMFLFVVTHVLQAYLGYEQLVPLSYLSGEHEGVAGVWWQHWLIDGWFPLLPWLPLGLCGILFTRIYQRAQQQKLAYAYCRLKFLLPIVTIFVVGIVINLVDPSPFFIRYGYIELFYPPDMSFVFSAIGVVGLLLALAEFSTTKSEITWLQLLGSMTLAIYTISLLIIGRILSPLFFPIGDLASFFAIFFGHLMALTIIAHGFKMVRETYPSMPVVVKWLVGK